MLRNLKADIFLSRTVLKKVKILQMLNARFLLFTESQKSLDLKGP